MGTGAWLVLTIIVAVAVIWWAAKDHPLNHLDCRRDGCSFGKAETKMMAIGSAEPQKARVRTCTHCGATEVDLTHAA